MFNVKWSKNHLFATTKEYQSTVHTVDIHTVYVPLHLLQPRQARFHAEIHITFGTVHLKNVSDFREKFTT